MLRRLCLIAIALPLACSLPPAAAQVPVHNVIIKLIDEVDVPTRETGLLDDLLVREGDRVKRGSVIAQLDAEDIKLLHKQTEIQVEIAQAEAANRSALRDAEGELAVAQAELERAEISRKNLASSVSDAEYDRLKLAVIKAEAKRDKSQVELTIAELTAKLKQQDLEFTALQLQRRTIVSPLEGEVAQVYGHRGEWLESGAKVVRVIRLDKLRAEGFVDLANVKPNLKGAAVNVSVDLPGREREVFTGKIVFVSSEVDTFNRQVRVWAEIENSEARLQPGATAKMTILVK